MIKFVFIVRHFFVLSIVSLAFFAGLFTHQAAEAAIARPGELSAYAKVSYVSAGSPNTINVLSEAVIVRVRAVEAMRLAVEPLVAVSPGTRVRIAFRLINTGNVSARFNFSAESLPGNFQLQGLQLQQEGSHDNLLGDGRASLSLEPDAPAVTLWLTAKQIPAHLTQGKAQVQLRVLTQGDNPVEETIFTTLELIAGANVELAGQYSRTEVNAGDRVSMILRAGNQSLTGAAREVASANGQPITLNGTPSSVFMLRHELPPHTHYVDRSVTLPSVLSGARALFRLVGDAPFAYRGSVGASEADKVIEVAVALPNGLAPGQRQIPLVQYTLRIAERAPSMALSGVVEAFFGDSSPDKPSYKRSGPIVLVVGGSRLFPDLRPQVSRDSDEFRIDQKHTYSLSVANDGGRPTCSAVKLTAQLPEGMQVQGVEGLHWQCSSAGQQVSCESAQVLLTNSFSSTIELQVRVPSGGVPSGAGIDLVSRFEVAGGCEPEALSGNNSITDTVRISQGSNLTGRVWLDDDHNGRFDQGEATLEGWRAQLLYAGNLVTEAKTDASGNYRLSGLQAGRAYALRILSPKGDWHGLPQDDGDAKAQPEPEQGWLQYPRMQAGVDLVEQNLAVAPTGRVYDSVTREPVVDAVITLHSAQRASPDTYLGGGSGAQVVSDANGYYFFDFLPQASGKFQLEVQAPVGYLQGFSRMLPPQEKHLSLSVGSGAHKVANDVRSPESVYFTSLARSPGAKRLANNNLALDPAAASGNGLVLRMEVDRPEVEAVDFVNYSLFVKHGLSGSLSGLRISDSLPSGFSYVAGSARIALAGAPAQAAKAPQVKGTQLQFDLSALTVPAASEVIITYRARVGAIVKEGTRAINSASATAGALTSNQASAVVRVMGGVFSNDAFAVGKVFLDCDRDGRQGEGDRGVPGVRIYMEDGTFVETDLDGKYSLYGLKPLTHVFKLDATTLPSGAVPLVLSNRNAGNGNSRFVDLRNGELGRADFALSCSASIETEVEARYQRYAQMPGELENAVKIRLDQTVAAQGRDLDVKARPASGIINASGQSVTATQAANIANGKDAGKASTAPVSVVASAVPARAKPVPLARLLENADNSLGFLDLEDGDVLLSRQLNIRIKGHSATDLRLMVNDRVLGLDRVGLRSEVAKHHLAAWEYIGVNLLPGKNRLTLRQGDSDQTKTITVIAPGDLDKIEISLPKTPIADGKTPVAVQVRLLDRDGVVVGDPQRLTLETSAGLWQTEDLDPMTAGAQVVVKGGVATFDLQPPTEAGEVLIRLSSGSLKTEQRTAFVPELREMIAAGVLEGVVSLRNGTIKPAGARDGFERELRNFSRSWGNGNNAAGRAAFFLKGKVRGEYLLTAAYDSEKTAKERMFRDIQPDRYYPVYGDSSLRGFDAQSTSRLYLRVDKDRSYLVHGDFSTSANPTLRQLTQYNRAVTGVQHHLEKGRVSADMFASHDSLTQREVDIQPNGTSGPFRVFGGDYVENSERVEVITYDRNQPGLVVDTKTLSRFADYEIESFSGHLRFREPQASLDKDTLNPRIIRVTYEADGSGASFWLLGADVQVQVTDALKLGVIAIDDHNPIEPRTMRGATVQADLGENTRINAELALTRSPEAESMRNPNGGHNGRSGKGGAGQGARVELNHESGDLKAQFSAVQTDDAFENLSAPVGAGQTELRGRGDYRLDQKHTLKGELMDSKSNQKELSSDRTGASVSVERVISETLRVEVGSRVVKGTAQNAEGERHINLRTLRGKLTSSVPSLPGAVVYSEYEQDVRDSDKRMLALGADYKMESGGRVYGRHEAISSLGSLYDLGTQKGNYRSLFGAEHAYMEDGHAFSEYRDGGAISERGAEAAYGLRNGWKLDKGLRASTTFERTRALGGKAGEESAALTGTLEYLPDSPWKGSTSLELRRATREESLLNTFSLGYKVDADWTLLGKSVVYRVRGRGDTRNGDSVRTRQRLGAAYRQTASNGFDALGYYERRLETGALATADSARRDVHVVSGHVNVQPWTDTTFSGRYAFKQVNESGGGLASKASAHLVFGRVTRDLDEKWDVGVSASALLDGGHGRDRTALGVEVGRVLKDDLWLSVGYNFLGFIDRDFSDSNETAQGVYLRMRYKFDETSF